MSAAAPGPSVGRDVALEAARTSTAGRRSPWRGPGRRRRPPRSATAIQVARSSRPRASARPRQSSSGASPAQPIATSDWPWRQARPKESVITTAGSAPASSRRRARSARAERVGVVGQEHERVPSPGALEASTPAFAHTKPWRVRQISTPRSARSSSAVSSSTTCTWRGSLPCSAASACARSAGPDRRPARARGPRPWTRPCGRRRARRRRAAAALGARPRAAAPRGRRPARTSGRGPSGERRAAPSAQVRRRARRRPARRRVRGATSGQRSSALRSAARSPGVSTSSASDSSGSTCGAAPASRARSRVAAERLPGPKAGRDRVRAAPAAARWCPCRGGRARRRRRRPGSGPGQQRRPPRRGRVPGSRPGTSSTRSRRARRRARDAEQGRGALARLAGRRPTPSPRAGGQRGRPELARR